MAQDKYTEMIRTLGRSLIDDYLKTGHVATGINGPYDDPETEVRYMAHLIIITAVECLKFGHSEYKDVVEQLGRQVLGMCDEDGTYKMRQKAGKDQCNGVIGHAWLVEGLLYAYKVTGDDKYLDESERICMMHQFNKHIGLWGRPLMGNDDRAIDFTFNHELWYAATLAELLSVRKNELLEEQLRIFLDKIPHILTTNREGRVAHTIYKRNSIKESIKYKIVRLRDILYERIGKPNLKYKEVGYHIFNMMAFARLWRVCRECEFLLPHIAKSLDYVNMDGYANDLLSSNVAMDCTTHGKTLTDEEQSINIYGYPYNVPGFELPYIAEVFKREIDIKSVVRIINDQIEQTWDTETQKIGKKCHDKVTVNYRVYEYYRYLELTDEKIC